MPRVHRSSAPTGIAQTERLVLAVLGGLVCFAGFVALLWSAVPSAIRPIVGLPLVVAGTALTWLGVRSVAAPPLERSGVAPQALLPIERAALAPFALASVIGFVVVALRGGIAGWVRFPLLVTTGLLALLLGWVTVVNRLPERLPTPDPEPVPDRRFENRDD